MAENVKPVRRVYKPELLQRAGMGDTWLRKLVQRGAVPPPRTDPGGKRQFWLDPEADEIIAGGTITSESSAIRSAAGKKGNEAQRAMRGEAEAA